MTQLLSMNDCEIIPTPKAIGGELTSTSVTQTARPPTWPDDRSVSWGSSVITTQSVAVRPVMLFATARPHSNWLSTVQSVLERFRDLGPGWDSYDAPAVDRQGIETAREFLTVLARAGVRMPALTLAAQGQVQIEWHTPSTDLEIRVLGPNRFSVLYEHLPENVCIDGVVSAASPAAVYSQLLPFLQSL
jgi:hypothetical protein